MLDRKNKIRAYHETSAADLLKETMDYYHITQADLADRIGVSQKHISELLSRKQYMSEDVALRLEKVLGTSSKLLLNLDSDYRLHQAKERLKNVQPNEKNPKFLQQYDWVHA